MSWQIRARFAGAQHGSNALGLGDRVNTIDCGKPDRFDCAEWPADLRDARVGRVPKAEVRALIVRRDIAAAAHHILTLAHTVGLKKHARLPHRANFLALQ